MTGLDYRSGQSFFELVLLKLVYLYLSSFLCISMVKKDLLKKTIIMVLLAELAGLFGSFFTLPSIATWYSSLVKPWFTPPSWVFGPVWILLYALMGIAAAIIWNSEKSKIRETALRIYFVQLAFNISWSIVFFGLNQPFLGFVNIVILWISIIFTIQQFGKISKTSANLMVPYLLWVTFATALNAAIWLLN